MLKTNAKTMGANTIGNRTKLPHSGCNGPFLFSGYSYITNGFSIRQDNWK